MRRVGIAVGCFVASASMAAQSISYRALDDSSKDRSQAGSAGYASQVVSAERRMSSPLRHAHVGAVSDWTQHYSRFSAPKSAAIAAKLEKDPRWAQSLYSRQRRGSHHGNRKAPAKVQGDWNVVLGTTTFEPMFDFNYSLDSDYEQGYGTLNSLDLVAENAATTYGGAYLATNGSLTVTAGSGTGIYQLTPGGPGSEEQPTNSGYYTYNNVLFPDYPALTPPFTDFAGVSFGNSTNNMLFVESGGSDYNFWWESGAFSGTFSGVAGVQFEIDPDGGQTYPAKYTWDVAATPACAGDISEGQFGDYVVVGIPAPAAAGSQANIVGYTNLYTGSSPSGICSGSEPTVLFAYATANGGEVPGSVALSLDGAQLAFIEDILTGSSYFHVLTIGTESEGTDPTTGSVQPGVGSSNAVDNAVLLSPDMGMTNQASTTAPFIDYASNAAYVSTYSWLTGNGYLYKIADVFGGSTPTIAWSVQILAIPSSPVFDSVSNEIFFTDNLGNIDYVTDLGSSGSSVTSFSVASGTTSLNPVTVDSVNEMVYATFNTNGTNALVVQAPTSLASDVAVPVGMGNTWSTGPYGVDFNNAWYTGSGTPELYVIGTDTATGTIPTLYEVGFNDEGVMNASATASAALATGAADSSSVTEFYNPNIVDPITMTAGEDFLFVGVTNNCAATEGDSAGCVLSLDITSGFPASSGAPATISASTTAIEALGGSTGIIVDNDSSDGQASNVYYGTKDGGTLVKAAQAGLD